MSKLRVAVVGYGNIGKYAIEALRVADDMEIAGVVRRNASVVPDEIKDLKVVSNIDELGKVDVAILATPTRDVPATASAMLELLQYLQILLARTISILTLQTLSVR